MFNFKDISSLNNYSVTSIIFYFFSTNSDNIGSPFMSNFILIFLSFNQSPYYSLNCSVYISLFIWKAFCLS
nr:MAG TPA: hypothetical protein [Caudoviricetes sp.]